jgi:hypothetical protein
MILLAVILLVAATMIAMGWHKELSRTRRCGLV